MCYKGRPFLKGLKAKHLHGINHYPRHIHQGNTVAFNEIIIIKQTISKRMLFNLENKTKQNS